MAEPWPLRERALYPFRDIISPNAGRPALAQNMLWLASSSGAAKSLPVAPQAQGGMDSTTAGRGSCGANVAATCNIMPPGGRRLQKELFYLALIFAKSKMVCYNKRVSNYSLKAVYAIL